MQLNFRNGLLVVGAPGGGALLLSAQWMFWPAVPDSRLPVVLVSMSRLCRRDFLSLQATFPMNKHVCVILW